jgi:P27 family predicted phage terminase small subunit
MAKRGRKPKAPELGKLYGEGGANLATPIEGRPVAPSHLSDVARAEFDRIVDVMDKLGTLSKSDGDSIALYANHYATWCAAREVIKNEGMITYSKSGFAVKHPAVTISNEASKSMQSLLGEFGLTPSARAKVNQVRPSEDDASVMKWEGLA